MDPQLFSHPGFIGGMIGGLLGLLGGAIGFYFSWRAAKSRKERRGMILFTIVALVLIGVHCSIQLGMSDGTVKTVDEVIYPFLLVGLLLFYIRWERRGTMSAHKTIQGAG